MQTYETFFLRTAWYGLWFLFFFIDMIALLWYTDMLLFLDFLEYAKCFMKLWMLQCIFFYERQITLFIVLRIYCFAFRDNEQI